MLKLANTITLLALAALSQATLAEDGSAHLQKHHERVKANYLLQISERENRNKNQLESVQTNDGNSSPELHNQGS